MKTKKISLLLLVSCLMVLGGLLMPSQAAAATYTTKAECVGNVLTVTATAPSSVTTNTAFTITGISSTSTAPNGFTINKIVSTTTVTNGTPSSMSGTWTGAGTGTFTAHFPDSTLTATEAAGSQVSVSLSSIDLYINGGSNPVTCSKANNQLTANKPGESLTLLSLAITAPVTSTPSSSPTSSPSPTPSSRPQTTNSSSAPTASAQTPSTPTPTTATPSSSTPTSSQSQSQPVTITVVDASGNPVANIPVQVDDSTPTPTSDQGTVTYLGLTTGPHKVAVLGKKTKVTQTINIAGGTDPASITIHLPRPGISPAVLALIGGTILIASILGVLGFKLYRRRQSVSGYIAVPDVTSLAAAQKPVTAVSASTLAMPSITEPSVVSQIVQPPVAVQPTVTPPPTPQVATTSPAISSPQQQYLSVQPAPVQPGHIIAPQAPGAS